MANGNVSIQGIGRVGALRPDHRSRPRRHWVITLDGTVQERLGKFKSGTLAAHRAMLYAHDINASVSGYALSFLKGGRP